ncbi:MAG: hypothetical protein ACREKL_08520, partial [Chthoniobacterales bacterium]
RARACHPDAPGGDTARFSALNAAQALLSDPAARLRLLAGDIAVPAMPPDAEFGFRVGAALREADAAIAKLAAGNALQRALLASETAAARKVLGEFKREWDLRFAQAGEKLRALDAAWPQVEPEQLASLGAEFRYLQRWHAQILERELALSV